MLLKYFWSGAVFKLSCYRSSSLLRVVCNWCECYGWSKDKEIIYHLILGWSYKNTFFLFLVFSIFRLMCEWKVNFVPVLQCNNFTESAYSRVDAVLFLEYTALLLEYTVLIVNKNGVWSGIRTHAWRLNPRNWGKPVHCFWKSGLFPGEFFCIFNISFGYNYNILIVQHSNLQITKYYLS